MLGQSLDSKQIPLAIGNIDMRGLLKCFARALCKHIEFSEGFLFLDDLKSITKQIYKEHGIPEESVEFSYGQGDLRIDLHGKKQTKEQKEQMKKEGEVKKQDNFNKIQKIFGQEEPQEKPTGKVFEYPEQPDQVEPEPEEEIDYSHEHLEEFMRSLNEHNKTKNFKAALEEEQKEGPTDYANNTMNPQQTDNLINEFLQNVNNKQGQDPQSVTKENPEMLSRRTGSEVLSSGVDRAASHHTGATLSNSLAYSQSNASALGAGQFNSIGLVSGVKSRQQEEDDNIEHINLEIKPEPVEELQYKPEEDDELERDESGVIDVGSPVNEVVQNTKPEFKPTKKDIGSYSDGMRVMNEDLIPGTNPALLNESNIYESQEVLVDKENKDTFKDYIETQMFLFHFNFDFENDGMILNEQGEIPSFPFLEYKPTEEEVYYY